MDIGNAMRRPFGNVTNLIIGIILMIIPIVNIITMPGYFMRVARTAMNKDKKLPGFNDFGNLIIDSIKAIVVLIVHYIVLIIVTIILALIPYLGPVLVLIWTIVFVFIMLSGFLTLAKTGDIVESIHIPNLAKKAAKANFIIAVIVAGIISMIIMAIIMTIILVGLGGAMLPTLMATMTTGVADPMAIVNMFGAIVGVGIIGGIIAAIIGYILQIFSITLIAEEY